MIQQVCVIIPPCTWEYCLMSRNRSVGVGIPDKDARPINRKYDHVGVSYYTLSLIFNSKN